MEILKFDGSGDGRCSGMKRTGQVVALLDGNVRICVHRCREGRRPETAKHCKNLPELLLRYFHLKLILQFLSTSISLSSSSRKIAETFWDREVIYRGRWDSELVDGIGPERSKSLRSMGSPPFCSKITGTPTLSCSDCRFANFRWTETIYWI